MAQKAPLSLGCALHPRYFIKDRRQVSSQQLEYSLFAHYVQKMQSKWPAVKRRAFGQICIKSIPFDKVVLHVNLTMHSSIHLLLDKLLHAG